MSRSACTVRRNGVTRGSAAGDAMGTASSRALLPMASPGATGADPVDGLTAGRPNVGEAASVLRGPAEASWPDGAEPSTAASAPLSVPTAARTATPADSLCRRPPRPNDLAIPGLPWSGAQRPQCRTGRTFV